MSAFPIEDALKPECDSLRADLLAIEKRIRALKKAVVKAHEALQDEPNCGNVLECVAQSMLAVRAVEDARMRIGKVLQYARDGVSCFDTAPGVTP